MNKRAIIILSAIFVLIVGTLGFLLYSRSNSAKTGTSQNQTTNTPPVTEQPIIEPAPAPTPTSPPPVATPAGPLRLIEEQVITPVLFYQGNGISYFNASGQLYQVDLKVQSGSGSVSNKRRVDLTPKSGVNKILWPSSGNNFIAELGNVGARTWSFYDSSRKQYFDLAPQIFALNWLPNATQIVYIWRGTNGKTSLNVSNPDGTNYSKLADIYYPDTEISVSPDGKNILFYRTQNTTEKNPITLVSSDGKFFKTVVKDGFNLGAHWAPDSKRFLFTRRDSLTSNFNLWMGNISSDEVKNLSLNTSVEKTLWSGDGRTIYVSASNPGVGQTKETIYKLNTDTYEKTEIVSGTSFSPRDMFISLASDALFFRNANDGGLYIVSLLQNSTATSGNNTGLLNAP